MRADLPRARTAGGRSSIGCCCGRWSSPSPPGCAAIPVTCRRGSRRDRRGGLGQRRPEVAASTPSCSSPRWSWCSCSRAARRPTTAAGGWRRRPRRLVDAARRGGRGTRRGSAWWRPRGAGSSSRSWRRRRSAACGPMCWSSRSWVSSTILTGWAGQLSLGQFGFAGVGGLSTVELRGATTASLGLHNLPWAWPPVGVLVGAAVGVVALSGCPPCASRAYLAVTTLAFAGTCRCGWSPGTFSTRRPVAHAGEAADAGGVDFAPRAYYYLCLVFLVLCRGGRPAAPDGHRPLGDRGARQPALAAASPSPPPG